MKWLLTSLVSSAVLLTSVSAFPIEEEGFYVGAMFGPAQDENGSHVVQLQGGGTATVKPKSNTFGSHAFAGYMLNPYAGFEIGFDYFSQIEYNTKGIKTCSTEKPVTNIIGGNLLGKLNLAIFTTGFDVFGKLGIGYMHQTNSGSLHPNTPLGCNSTVRESHAGVIFGLGASYDISANWSVDLSWMRYATGGITKNIDSYNLGLAYHFIEPHCGQFLC